MKKLFAFLFFTVWVAFSANAQLLSPYEYLSEYGTNFTLHHKVVDYAYHLAQHSDRVALFPYGESYEGRPLIYLAFSTPENIDELDSIRIHHLRQIGMTGGDFNEKYGRAIVWLSHGVHGNEAGATESALLNMYKLASGTSVKAGELEETIVIIDPCLNPDGFDKYVQFYQSRLGNTPNPNPYTAEHREPWPTGRVNHYQFDLNRDWAWQTQVESQQRMEVFFKWMPHIHVDIHEQFPENPYYFAPAAPPFHQAIEDWQIDLQKNIGKNNAHYFDKEGWAYFTGEVFDLFYPSYGDTYPILNGAIGMTYEQAGHGIAGLVYALDNGDSLRLKDRINHHSTTAMATVESTRQLGDTLIQLQTDYFQSYKPSTYQAYIFRQQGEQLSFKKSFAELLDKNRIKYQMVGNESGNTTMDIWNFGTEEEERYTLQVGDLYIPADQKSGRLLEVLTETSPILEDTMTYDITSWSIALAYGDLYGLQTTIPPTDLVTYDLPERISDKSRVDSNYAAILRFRSEEDYEFLAKLLANGYSVRIAKKHFTPEGQDEVAKGSVVLLKADNRKKYSEIFEFNENEGNRLDFIGTGWTVEGPDLGSDAFQLMKAPKVALLRDDKLDENGFGFAWHFLDQSVQYPYDVLSKSHLLNRLSAYNTVMIPDGKISFSEEELGEWKEWISGGGRLIVTGNSVKAFAGQSPFQLQLKADVQDTLREEVHNEYASHHPGAVVQLDWDNEHPLGYHMADTYYSLKTSSLAIEPLGKGTVGKMREEMKVYGFIGNKVRHAIENTMAFGVEQHGKGKLIYLVDDPLYRGFWKRGHQIVWNALFFVQ